MAKSKNPSRKPVYAFIDASNLFYGGEKSLGWKIDYRKLALYIKEKYQVRKIYYYGGVEINDFPYSVLDKEPINLDKLISHLEKRMKRKEMSEGSILVIDKHIKRIKFYRKLSQFGYILKLKPVKIFRDEDGNTTKKANCDVDMTFDLMRLKDEYSGVLVLSGDGDFAVVLKYLREIGKEIKILARSERTAREIKQLAGEDFRDFNMLRTTLEFFEKK